MIDGLEQLARDAERAAAETDRNALVEQLGGEVTLEPNPLALSLAGRLHCTESLTADGRRVLRTTVLPRSKGRK